MTPNPTGNARATRLDRRIEPVVLGGLCLVVLGAFVYVAQDFRAALRAGHYSGNRIALHEAREAAGNAPTPERTAEAIPPRD